MPSSAAQHCVLFIRFTFISPKAGPIQFNNYSDPLPSILVLLPLNKTHTKPANIPRRCQGQTTKPNLKPTNCSLVTQTPPKAILMSISRPPTAASSTRPTPHFSLTNTTFTVKDFTRNRAGFARTYPVWILHKFVCICTTYISDLDSPHVMTNHCFISVNKYLTLFICLNPCSVMSTLGPCCSINYDHITDLITAN